MPFSSIVGHAPIVALLRHAVERGRVPHTLLFGGPEGVGKRTVAIALAQAVNCPNRRDGDACGRCSTCTRIASGLHSDVALIDRGDEASIKIDLIRARVLEVIGYRPFEGRRRVFIIDDAERLTEQSQDALLKTLEEPPGHALLILVTRVPDMLKPTVQSRCRRLRFGLLTTAEVERVLVGLDRPADKPAKNPAKTIDRAGLTVRAAASGGSVGRALAAEAGELIVDRRLALDLLEAGAGGTAGRLRASAALAQNKSKRRDRDALRARLAATSSLLRDLGALAAGGAASLTNGDEESALRRLSRAYSLPRVEAAFAAIVRAQDALDRNASPKIVADWVAVAL